MGKSKWDKSPAQIEAEKRTLTPLAITAKDAAFLNKIREVAVNADERAKKGGSGVALYPVSALRKLLVMAGKTPEYAAAAFDDTQKKYLTAYPTGTQNIYNELRYVRIRIQAHKDQKNANA